MRLWSWWDQPGQIKPRRGLGGMYVDVPAGLQILIFAILIFVAIYHPSVYQCRTNEHPILLKLSAS